MPKPYPKEFRDDVVNVARTGEPGQTIKQIAADFGIAESCLRNWMHQADIEDGHRPCRTETESAELRALNRRNRLLEQENEVLRRACGVPVAGEHRPKMMYPLVRELAAAGAPIRVPLTVTCRAQSHDGDIR